MLNNSNITVEDYKSSSNNNNNSVPDNITNSFRSKSPFTRSAYPGVVLMSPQSASKSTSSSFKQSQISMFQPIKNTFTYNNNNNNYNNNNNSDNSSNILSFDDMLDKVIYESTNLPSIQHPIPIPSNFNPTSSVPYTDISYETISFNKNSNNSYDTNSHIKPINTTATVNNSSTYNPLLSPNDPSPLLQQYINSNTPLDQMYPSYPNQQYLDLPHLNNSNNTALPNSTFTNTNPNGFFQELTTINHWMKNLSVQQQIMAIDNILSLLSNDILFHTKTKIDSILQSSNVNGSFSNSTSPSIATNVNTSYNNNNNNNNNNISNSVFEEQCNPEFPKLDSLLINNRQSHISNNISRYLTTKTKQHNNNNNNTKNKPSYHPWSPQPVSRKQPTFNMERPKSVEPGMLTAKRSMYQQSTSKHSFESSSVSATVNNGSISNAINSVNGNDRRSIPPTNNSMTPENLCNPSLLKDIPAWLKSLRLHKYSNCLSKLPWYTLIYLTDEELEVKGVSALGARRKLLKAFNIVKDYKERDLIDKSAY